jgi:hypothetical protein
MPFLPQRAQRDLPAAGSKPGRYRAGRMAGFALAGALVLGAAGAAVADEHWEDALQRTWDGEVMNVPWDGGDEYETIAGDRFAHNAVAVPGDWVHRAMVVENKGPCPGRLTVEILNPDSAEAPDTVNHDDPSVTDGRTGFEGMSEVHWDVGGQTGSGSFSALAHEQKLATVPVAKDGSVRVQMAYRFPYEETEGKHLGFASQALTWDVGLELQGDCKTTVGIEKEDDIWPDFDEPSPGPSTPPPPDAGDDDGAKKLPFTGTNALFAAISAVFLIAAGATALAGRRRTDS